MQMECKELIRCQTPPISAKLLWGRLGRRARRSRDVANLLTRCTEADGGGCEVECIGGQIYASNTRNLKAWTVAMNRGSYCEDCIRSGCETGQTGRRCRRGGIIPGRQRLTVDQNLLPTRHNPQIVRKLHWSMKYRRGSCASGDANSPLRKVPQAAQLSRNIVRCPPEEEGF